MKRSEVRPVRWQPIIGEPEQVRNALQTAYARGDLVQVATPRRLRDGRVRVDARMVVPVPRPRRRLVPRWQRRRVVAAVGVLGAAATVVAGVVWLVVTAVTWLAEHLGAVLGVAAVVFLVLAGIVRSGAACGGHHCPGCGCS